MVMRDEGKDFFEDVEAIRWESTPALRGGLTASCLYFLFADLFLTPISRWSRFVGVPGMAVPSSNAIVSLGRLEVELLVVALWDLRVQGHLAISWAEPIRRRLPIGDHRDFSLRLIPSNCESPITGLEANLLSALGNSSCDLYALINDRWLDQETLPVNGIVVLAQREALSRGLLFREQLDGRLPKSLAWAKSSLTYAGDSNAVQVFQDAAAQLVDDVIDNAAGFEWKTLVREISAAVLCSRPYFRFESGGSG